MKALRDQAAAGKANLNLALLSCLLFTCIEVIRDNVFAALALLTNGIKLLNQITGQCHGMNQELFKTIKQTFVRMSLTSAAFGHWLPIDISPDRRRITNDNVFASMNDARDAIFALNQDCHGFLQDAARLWVMSRNGLFENGKQADNAPHAVVGPAGQSEVNVLRYGCTAEAGVTQTAGNEDLLFSVYEAAITGNLMNRVPTVLKDKGDELERRIRDWYPVFERSGFTRNEDDSACSLQMLYHVTLVCVAIRTTPTQTAFDDYDYHFREIVRLAEIHNARKDAEKAMFTLEVGALAPLWFVITKCRIPSLRRRALSLVSHGVKKESVFGARSMGEIAVRIIEFEEVGLRLPVPSLVERVDSPLDITDDDDDRRPIEDHRMPNLEILVNRSVGRFEIRVTRYLRGLEGYLIKEVRDR